TRRRRGGAQPNSSMSEDMDLKAVTKVIIGKKRSATGPNASAPGRDGGTTCSCISTTIKKVLPPPTPSSYVSFWAERARDGRRSPWQTIQWVFVSLHFSMSSSVVPLCCSLSTGLFQGLLVCLSDFQSVCWRGSSFGFSLLMGHLVRKIPSIADRSLPRKSKSVNGTHVRTGRFACWFIQRGVLR